MEVVFGASRAIPHDRLEASDVAGYRRVLAGDGIHQGLGQASGRSLLRKTVVDPASFAVAIQEARLSQQAKMARDSRLALTENLNEVGDGQVTMGAENQQSEPGRLGRCLHGGQKTVHCCPPWSGAFLRICHHKDIKISLCQDGKRKLPRI